MNNLLVFIILSSYLVYFAQSCGCMPGRCDVNGTLISGECSTSGVCDCCQVCNSCNQLFGGCLANQFNVGGTNPQFSPAIPANYGLRQSLQTRTSCFQYTSPSGQVVTTGFQSACVTPDLPEGLNITLDGDRLCLVGSPEAVAPSQTYRVIVKGPTSNGLFSTSITFGVIPDCISGSSSSSGSASSSSSSGSSSSTSGSSSCTTGQQQCLTSETYNTCVNGAYGVDQSCPLGTTCHAADAPYQGQIQCY